MCKNKEKNKIKMLGDVADWQYKCPSTLAAMISLQRK